MPMRTLDSRAQSPHSVRPARELPRTLRVLKHGDTFAVLDELGDAGATEKSSEGLYHLGTRFLSTCRLFVGGRPPLLLGSALSDDNTLLAVDMANAATEQMPADTVHIARTALVYAGTFYQRITISNYGDAEVTFDVTLELDADFLDIFEVRGSKRGRRGAREPAEVHERSILFRYEGLDGFSRTVRVSSEGADCELTENELTARATIGRGESWCIVIRADCESQERVVGGERPSYGDACELAERAARRNIPVLASIRSSNHQFDAWLARSATDIGLMLWEAPTGPYPHAGVPWFNAVFGRDGIITALETLWAEPAIARGVLEHLAATQARLREPVRDAEPGKVVHEERQGEMANTGEVPFGRYYGSVDATPLFLCLAGAYFQRTDDMQTIVRIWPSLLAALGWIERSIASGRDPFLRYARAAQTGLVNQGWKDSADAIFHGDGTLAPAPIALCEVQGYVYAARQRMAELFRARGDEESAHEQLHQAGLLRDAFERRFWSDELGTYALAIDGDDRVCRVRSSNPGHCLFFDAVPLERARTVAHTLMSKAMFTGWGVRTIATGEARYNPMSYHNGSVWPHDSAIAGAGMARYGAKRDALHVLTGLFDASRHFDTQRLPELLCGFDRVRGRGPTRYPVACSPQAWAAGAVFLLLEACLGLSIDARARMVSCDRPQLPPWLDWVSVEGLEVGPTRLDLVFRRSDADVSVSVAKLTREREPEVVVVKRV